MNRPMPSRSALACTNALLGALLLSACAVAQTTPPAAASAPASNQLYAPVQQLIGDARCTSDAQCRTIGVGHKACGGPGGYLAWSTYSTPDEAGLRRAVERHAQAVQQEQQRSGMLSNCMAVIDPGARCVPDAGGGPGRCRLNGTRGVGAP
jgi:hypothetical protein